KIALLIILVFSSTISLKAQEQSLSVSGTVTDIFGNPLEGVVVTSQNGKNGTSTDADGKYSLTLEEGVVALTFHSRAYATMKLDIGQNRRDFDISMPYDVHGKDDWV